MNKYILSICTALLTLPGSASAQLEFEWAKHLKGTSNVAVYPKGVEQDPNGNVVVAGEFLGKADFDPGSDTLFLTAQDKYDSFIEKLDPQGNLIWVKQLKGIDNQNITDIVLDQAGNMVVTGTFWGNIVFDANTMFQTAPDIPKIFIARYDQNGNFLWAGQMGGDEFDYGAGLDLDAQGNIYTTGYFYSNPGDFNPDPNAVFPLNAGNSSSMYVVKLDPQGQFLWAKAATGPGFYCKGNDLVVEGNHLYIAGQFGGSVDFDFGANTNVLTATGNGDGFVQKLDLNGNLVWARQFSGAGRKDAIALTVDPQGNVIVTGEFNNSVDLNPGGANLNVNSTVAGTLDIYVVKLGPNGNFLWGYTLGAEDDDQAGDVKTDQAGNVYVLGGFIGRVDFDPGADTSFLQSEAILSTDIFLQFIDVAGNLVDLYEVGGNATDLGLELFVNPENDVFMVGRYSALVDFDPGPGVYQLNSPGWSAGFVTKWRQPWDFSGTVFDDLNGNLVQDAGEPGLYGVLLYAEHNEIFASTDSSGIYHFYAGVEGDTIHPFTRPYILLTPGAQIVGTANDGYDFAATVPPAIDVCIAMVETAAFRPGFQTKMVILVSNIGSLPADSIPVKFRIVKQTAPDPLVFINADPAPMSQDSNKMEWLIDHLDVNETATIEIIFLVPATTPLGTDIIFSSSAILSSDADLSNNGSRIDATTVGSFDPNDKKVEPALVAPAALDTTDLKYLIRFQNTGTFPAELVVVKDTLPLELDIRTLKVLGASHPFTWRISGSGILEFRFDPIYLPDSTSNEPASKGFIVFTVKPKPGLVLGDSVRNRVGIYFDFNEPVITNFADMRVGTSVGTKALTDNWVIDFDLVPNPAAAGTHVLLQWTGNFKEEVNVRVLDVSGRIVQSVNQFNSEQPILLDPLPSGSYFIQVRTSTGKLGGKTLLIK